MTSIVIVGGGIVGTLIAREAAKYKLSVTLIEKEVDLAFGSTKANTGIIHAGYDDPSDTLKAQLCVQGNRLWPRLSQHLHFPFKKTGSLVIATTAEECRVLDDLLKRGQRNGVAPLHIIQDTKTLRALEPHLTPQALAGLYAPSAGTTSPYEAAIAAAENAQANGVRIILGQPVESICVKQGVVTGVRTNKGLWPADYVINAAGLNADLISALAGISTFSITPIKGEYLLYDKRLANIVNHVLFPVPTLHTKGIVVTHTVHGNLLLGPTALPQDLKQNFATTASGLRVVIDEASKLVPSLVHQQDYLITYFAGLRAEADTGDFIVTAYDEPYGFINAAGIKSPGLTAAPAIAQMIIGMLSNLNGHLIEKSTFTHLRKPIPRPLTTSLNIETQRLIATNPRYGHLICRCEHVSEGEVIEAVRRGASTLDGVKFRTRAGMGRCQGGFCTPHLIRILAHELGIKVKAVTKRGQPTYLLSGPVKESWIGDDG